jgi:CDP-diacylglycerol--serine O-phosphatidyltransferase
MKHTHHTDEQPQTSPRPVRNRRQSSGLILRSISILPATFTLLNGLFGFGAIHMATRVVDGKQKLGDWGDLEIACWFIFLAMLCDMLDGRLARWARKTSDFGAQLDSLCDAISFGVAPAILMLRAVAIHVDKLDFLPDYPIWERFIWCIAAAYLACGVIRLARFNVENQPDESAHMSFKGLPIPGAAAVVATMVLLYTRLSGQSAGWQSSPALLAAVVILLPIATALAAMLMVSRFRYPHLLNQYVRGKKPFGYLLKLLIIVLAGTAQPFLTATAAALIFALSGPIGAILRKVRKEQSPPAAPTPQ